MMSSFQAEKELMKCFLDKGTMQKKVVEILMSLCYNECIEKYTHYFFFRGGDKII